jgi:hypothetical protein
LFQNMVPALDRAKGYLRKSAIASLTAPFSLGSAESDHRAFQGRGKFLGGASTGPPDH